MFGHRRGHGLGFPTANVGSLDALTLPPDGVYSALVFLPHLARTLGATVSMGWNPTFDDVLEHRVEAHLHDFGEDIYGEVIEVTIVARLRDMRRFADASELSQQIEADVQTSRRLLAARLQGDGASRMAHADSPYFPHIS